MSKHPTCPMQSYRTLSMGLSEQMGLEWFRFLSSFLRFSLSSKKRIKTLIWLLTISAWTVYIWKVSCWLNLLYSVYLCPKHILNSNLVSPLMFHPQVANNSENFVFSEKSCVFISWQIFSYSSLFLIVYIFLRHTYFNQLWGPSQVLHFLLIQSFWNLHTLYEFELKINSCSKFFFIFICMIFAFSWYKYDSPIKMNLKV